MTTEFGMVDDINQNDGQTFGQNPDDDNHGATDDKGITPAELEALRIRDAAAQAHIPDLESENAQLRDTLVELEAKLVSATTLDSVLERITNKGKPVQTLDPAAVTQIVDQVLTQKQTKAAQDNNWNSVYTALTTVYGDWKTADAKVRERAQELDIALDDATTMAKNNPKAFLQLFNPTTHAPNPGGVRSGGAGQTVPSRTLTGETRDAAWYKKLRRENPKAYWSVEVQAQYRRDMHNAT